jgi:DNA (cytosine-5)-methyltransferase 1
MSIEAVDLFCGAGGLTCGLRQAGVRVRLGVDVDQACEFPYAKNNRAACIIRDVKEISSDEMSGHFSGTADYRLVAGCAPCQTFSSYNQKANTDDSRWWLLREFIRVVEDVNPEFVTMENVPGLAEHDVFDEFLAFLAEHDYHVDHKVLKCMEYGIPQQRERLVLIASRLGPIEILPPSRFRLRCDTVADAIRELPPIGVGETHPDDPMHQCATLSDLNMERMRASTPGGTWRDWPKHLVAKCHQKASGKTYPAVYGRMTWNAPSPTITTQFFGFGNGRFGHPEQDRAISLREGAILQSFPPNYKFTKPGEPIHKTILGRMIGNAVPVRLGLVIGRSFQHHVRMLEREEAI